MISLYILYINPLSNVGLVNIYSQSIGCWVFFIFYWQCPLCQRIFAILWGPICLFFILKHKPFMFCSGNFPLCPCVQGFSPLSLLLDSVYLILCGGLWFTWTWALYKKIRMDQFVFEFVYMVDYVDVFPHVEPSLDP